MDMELSINIRNKDINKIKYLTVIQIHGLKQRG